MPSNGFLKRLNQYLQERFPPKQMLPLAAVISLSSGVLAQSLSNKTSFQLLPYLLSFSTLLLFFLHLRIFDEFKDYHHDKKYYPGRPVPRGIINLQELKVVGVAVISLEMVLSLFGGSTTFLLYLVCLGYSLLMFKEFFIRKWLKNHFTFYIASHEILTIPLIYYLYSFNFSDFFSLFNPILFVGAVFLAATLFLLEVARKIRPKELEIASRDTYTSQYGITGGIALLISLGVIVLTTKFFILKKLFGQSFIMILDLLFFGLLFYSTVSFKRSSTKNLAKRIFYFCVIFTLVVNISFVVVLWPK